MEYIQNAALAEHDVVIQVLAQTFPQFHRMLVKLRICIEQVIRPDYSCVAAGISTADITLFQHLNYNVMFSIDAI